MINPFYRHGIFANSESMEWLADQLDKTGRFGEPNNENYSWRDEVVRSGLELADRVLAADDESKVLLIGHSQGGLVSRVAAVALAGTQLGTRGQFTERIVQWQCDRGAPNKALGKLAVVTIATPNAGALTAGQISVAAELLGRTIFKAVHLLDRECELLDLRTPRLFQEFQNWRVAARYLSVSGVCVNRYSRGLIRDLAELWPVRCVSVRFDIPNDLVVEDSSTDLRQSLIRPEIDLAHSYRHVRAYPKSISLNHRDVRKSPEVVNVIIDNLDWLFA
ncbi:MAG: hypothetical protein OXC15_17495 [Rhodospirillaceae bacterium]|nr:hypothetical protein [Rhodospirillaceae bacterium]